jgi:hypothetical protein
MERRLAMITFILKGVDNAFLKMFANFSFFLLVLPDRFAVVSFQSKT